MKRPRKPETWSHHCNGWLTAATLGRSYRMLGNRNRNAGGPRAEPDAKEPTQIPRMAETPCGAKAPE